MNYYPSKTSAVIRFDRVIDHKGKILPDERMSTRMVKCASAIDRDSFIGWQLFMPVRGLAEISVFGSERFTGEDLKWITEHTAKSVGANKAKYTAKSVSIERGKVSANSTGNARGKASANSAGNAHIKASANSTGKTSDKYATLKEVYELYLPVNHSGREIGFGSRMESGNGIVFGSRVESGSSKPAIELRFGNPSGAKWPVYYSRQFSELMRVFRNTGAVFRVVLGSADREETVRCEKHMLYEWRPCNIDPQDYLGNPVRIRVLLRLTEAPSIRLLTVLDEAVPGVSLKYLGSIDDTDAATIWDSPLEGAAVLPDFAARIIMMEPAGTEGTMGIKTCGVPMREISASHDNTRAKRAICIGRATDTSGTNRKITIGDLDLRRHYQIVGQTGTGKSTLLTQIILSGIEQDYGLTFFDPHGSTIDAVLRSVPEKYADRIRVVRIGDTENPVPLNIWDSDDPEKEERNISDLCELFADIFDPNQQGYAGPRYMRWLSTFCRASIAFLGRASLESITILSRDQENMHKLYNKIVDKYPEIAAIIKAEYGTDRSSDFTATLSWYLCKFQSLTSVKELRQTLGARANALDFNHTIDTNTVTLIDLASPSIGTNAARVVGTLVLMKLWNAALTRKDRDRTHLVLLDEAALWKTNPLPRMCAEGRKFGLSLVLSHQHAGQLTGEIRDALEANSANFSAFRLSAKDAAVATVRLDDPDLQVELTRLDAYKAITTLSIDGRQTAPFTLHVAKPKEQKDADRIAKMIGQKSIEQLVEPYRDLRALTPDEIQHLLDKTENAFIPRMSDVHFDELREDDYYFDDELEVRLDDVV